MFPDIYKEYSFKDVSGYVKNKSRADVELALHEASLHRQVSFEDFLALVSPAAGKYLEEMAVISKNITLERFGNTIQLFMPLYLSNECRSSCTYCGFRYENEIPRKTLTRAEIEAEADIIFGKGIRHVLALTGEDYSKTSYDYIMDAVTLLRKKFPSVSVEIYPLKTEQYAGLVNAGVEGLALYQETYDPEKYRIFHTRGMKKNLEYRLEGPDRGGIAGFRRIGLGVLLGLSDPYGELFFLGLHAGHILKNYWKTLVQLSFPRIRPTASGFQDIVPVSDREFVRFMLAFRLYIHDAGLVLSTRETAGFRDNMVGLGITSMSVESRTDPGGYSGSNELEQFAISDERTVAELTAMLKSRGFDPVKKDFDRVL